MARTKPTINKRYLFFHLSTSNNKEYDVELTLGINGDKF